MSKVVQVEHHAVCKFSRFSKAAPVATGLCVIGA